MGASGRLMLIWLRLTQNVILPVVSPKVGEGHRVLDVDSELLRILQDGGLAGELLVIFHRAPGRDLAVIFSRPGILETLACGQKYALSQRDNTNSPHESKLT